MRPPEGYVTPSHAARIAGCSLGTIFRWINKNYVQSMRSDHPGLKRQHRYVSRASLDEMLRVVPANEYTPPQPLTKPKTPAWAKAFLASRGVG